MKKIIKWIISRYTMKRHNQMFIDKINNKPVYKYIDKYNNQFMAQSKFELRISLDECEEDYRECHTCGDKIDEGYCIENGEEYYCSDECLYTKYTIEEYEEMYNNGDGNSYYTSWID
jgi:hypothetical protein